MNNVTTLINAATVPITYESVGSVTGLDLAFLFNDQIDLEITTVTGSTSPGLGRVLNVYYAFSSAPVTSSHRQKLLPAAQKARVALPGASETRITRVTVEKSARYIYVWTEHDPLESTVSLTVKIISGVPILYPPSVLTLGVPSNDTYDATENLDFTVTYDRAITVTGTPYILVTIGSATVQANYLSGSGTAALVFRYTVVLLDEAPSGIVLPNYITLGTARLKDSSKEDADLSLPAVVTTGIIVHAPLPPPP